MERTNNAIRRHTSICANKNDLLDIAVGFDVATTECLGSGIYYVLLVEVFLLLGYVVYYQGLHHGTMCASKRYPVTTKEHLICSHVWNPCYVKRDSKNDTRVNVKRKLQALESTHLIVISTNNCNKSFTKT